MTPEEARQEAKDLLRQSNDVDYAETMKKFDQKAGCHLPPDTPVRYATVKYNGFFTVGLKLVMLVNTKHKTLVGAFDRPMRTQREGGEVHACIDVFGLNTVNTELDQNNGEYLIEESTLGDKDTFCKYVDAILDYDDEYGKLDKDIRELAKKEEQ